MPAPAILGGGFLWGQAHCVDYLPFAASEKGRTGNTDYRMTGSSAGPRNAQYFPEIFGKGRKK
jgi:hypothetical protein